MGERREETFEPNILMFACNWCSYAAVDLAGTSRMKTPPNIKIIRVMCSGRVDPEMILEAFANGADGVLVTGCRIGDCHYIQGNYKTLRRILLLKRLLPQLGIEPERLRLEWISAADAIKFVRVANEMTETVRKLGPLKPKLEAINLLLKSLKEVE